MSQKLCTGGVGRKFVNRDRSDGETVTPGSWTEPLSNAICQVQQHLAFVQPVSDPVRDAMFQGEPHFEEKSERPLGCFKSNRSATGLVDDARETFDQEPSPITKLLAICRYHAPAKAGYSHLVDSVSATADHAARSRTQHQVGSRKFVKEFLKLPPFERSKIKGHVAVENCKTISP